MLRAEGGEIDFQLRAFCDFYAGEEIKASEGRGDSLRSRFLPFYQRGASFDKSKTTATQNALLLSPFNKCCLR
jgi:hypothetical protein